MAGENKKEVLLTDSWRFDMNVNRYTLQNGIKDPLINLSHPLALRQIVSQGAVPQEGWLPFKVLQSFRSCSRYSPTSCRRRGEAICLKAPPGAVPKGHAILTAIRCVVPLANAYTDVGK